MSTSAGSCLHIMVPVQDYEEYREILNPNDILLVTVARVRDPVSGEFFFSEEKYGDAKSKLIEVRNVPVRKGIIFSSYEDLEDKIDDIAPYIDLVGYNSEWGMTPADELAQIEESVGRFAELVRSRGLAMGWGPTSTRLHQEPELLKLASEIDQIMLQHQNDLAHGGVEATVALTQERGRIIRESNPAAKIGLQLKGGLGEIGEVLRQTRDYVDAVLILTHYGIPFNYQQLFENDVDLRSRCRTLYLPNIRLQSLCRLEGGGQ